MRSSETPALCRSRRICRMNGSGPVHRREGPAEGRAAHRRSVHGRFGHLEAHRGVHRLRPPRGHRRSHDRTAPRHRRVVGPVVPGVAQWLGSGSKAGPGNCRRTVKNPTAARPAVAGASYSPFESARIRSAGGFHAQIRRRRHRRQWSGHRWSGRGDRGSGAGGRQRLRELGPGRDGRGRAARAGGTTRAVRRSRRRRRR